MWWRDGQCPKRLSYIQQGGLAACPENMMIEGYFKDDEDIMLLVYVSHFSGLFSYKDPLK